MRSFSKSIVLLLVCVVFVDVTDEKSVSVNEGESVTLNTDVTKLQNNDKIRWRFGEEGSATLIAEMTGGGAINFENDARFKDRLQILDLQTGDLIIKNIKQKHSGRYEVDYENNTGTAYQKLRVTVNDAPPVFKSNTCEVKSESETVGDSVTLNTDIQTQRDDLILWRFGDDGVLIAKHDKEDNKSSMYDDVLDGRFRDRLKLDPHTGSLTITNTKTTDTGLYKLKISSNRDTKYKTFSVSVSGLFAGLLAETHFGFLLAIAVVFTLVIGVFSVIVYSHINYKRQKRMVKEKKVPKGDSVTLETHVNKPQSDDVIEWSFGDDVIATFNKNNSDEIFIDRLQVNTQTKSLTIRDIITEDAGLYKVKISSSSRLKSFLQFILGGGPSYRQFNVIVTETE